MKETNEGVTKSVYDMAIAGAPFGAYDSTRQHGKESASVTTNAKTQLLAEAFAQPANLAPQTHNYMGVAADVGNGMINEVVNNTGQLLQTVGESAVAGLAFRLAPPVVRGGALIAGGVYGAFKLAQNAPGWINDASTVVNSQSHTSKQVAKAHVGLEHFGGGVVELAAGGVAFSGGMYAPELYGAARGGYSGYRAGTLKASEVFPAMKTQFSIDAKAVNWSENPPWIKQTSDAFNNKFGEVRNWLNPGAAGKVPKPESATLLSREATSSLFETLAAKDGEFTFVKRPYTATIRDGVPGETVIDIQGKSQLVAAGNKVVQRIMPDGAVDTYPIDNQTFLARWRPRSNAPGEYTPNPVPTKMVVLDRTVQIPGHAGPQLGNVEDMLASDGAKFWTVQKMPLLETYVGADAKSKALMTAIGRQDWAKTWVGLDEPLLKTLQSELADAAKETP